MEQVFTGGMSVRVRGRTCSRSAACPGFRRVHSRYERRLLDTAAGGREVLICLTVRRFLCQAPACPKTTFAEQVSGLTSRHPRRTPGLSCVLEAVGLALAAWPYAPSARPRCTGCSVIAAARPRSPPGSSRNTVRRFRTRRRSRRAHRPRLPPPPPPRKAGILHDYESYPRERWISGCTNATMLWQEIRARGYPGGYSGVRDHLAHFRGNARMPAPAPEPRRRVGCGRPRHT